LAQKGLAYGAALLKPAHLPFVLLCIDYPSLNPLLLCHGSLEPAHYS